MPVLILRVRDAPLAPALDEGSVVEWSPRQRPMALPCGPDPDVPARLAARPRLGLLS